jgi:hypothetical protein
VGNVPSVGGLRAAAVIARMLGAMLLWVGAVRLQFADFTAGPAAAVPAVAVEGRDYDSA